MRNLLLKKLQSMLIATDDVQKTEEELEAELAARAEAEQNAPPPPEMVKLQVEREVAQLRFDVEMAKIAANGELTLEEIAAKLEGTHEQTASRERPTGARQRRRHRASRLNCRRARGRVAQARWRDRPDDHLPAAGPGRASRRSWHRASTRTIGDLEKGRLQQEL